MIEKMIHNLRLFLMLPLILFKSLELKLILLKNTLQNNL